jgi:hypothetical protein
MNKNEPCVAVYETHQEAEAAVKELKTSGFDMIFRASGPRERAGRAMPGRRD